ncbi:hypothetical protein EJ04DRAFT_553447 [Polyplosphaeria fusca]|uniref:Uncharacterized protein n=1 Tax=Polyplosphaeria fusca TaxID=682080 RepID=A0A9P4QXZ6_9PLEO|nr:hypothetical protein EJ04DRAFT_553447 [Polyplosphaeria fusca]
MADDEAAHHLLNVIEERGLDVDLDSVLAAFENDDTKRAVAAWTHQYLNEETLLTKEELQLYKALQKKGVLPQSEDEGDLTRPIQDQDLQAAIDSLNSSTAAIEEQCKVLEAQKDALTALKALDKPNLSVEHMRNDRRRRETQEKARLDIAVEDMYTTITEQLTDTQRDIDSEKAVLRTYVTERLTSDDKILTALPGIVSKIATEPEATCDEKSVDQWCKAIVSFRAGEIQARVNAIYLSSLTDPLPDGLQGLSEAELLEQKEALQAELESLHSEIATVAEMVVEHELRKPIQELKEREEKEIMQARSAWLKYVLSTLHYMSKRLDTVTTHTATLDELQQALAHVNRATSQRTPPSNTDLSSPARKRATSGPKPGFSSPVVRLKPPKAIELPAALTDALRHAGMTASHDSVESLRETMMNMQLERESKLDEHFSSIMASTHASVATRLGKADIDWGAISAALFSHTPFQAVRLTDPKLEGDIKNMERELETASQSLLDAEGNEISLEDAKVRAFVSAYGPVKK